VNLVRCGFMVNVSKSLDKRFPGCISAHFVPTRPTLTVCAGEECEGMSEGRMLAHQLRLRWHINRFGHFGSGRMADRTGKEINETQKVMIVNA
jgi:hypothetical protein